MVAVGTKHYTVAEARKLGLLDGVIRAASSADRALEREKQQAHALIRLLKDLLDDNHTVRLEYRFHPTRKWCFDVALLDVQIALEIDGGGWIHGRHHRPQGRNDDNEKTHEAQILGWEVIRVLPEHVEDGQAHALLRRLANKHRKEKNP